MRPVYRRVMASNMNASRLFVLVTAVALLGCGGQPTSTSSPETSESPRAETKMAPDLYIQQSLEGLRTQTAAHSSTWHLGDEENWAADQETGRITFTFADGTVAEADMQIVGTYNTDDGTFLWGWDHPSVAEPLSKHAALARQFGMDNGLPQYTERMVECTEDQAWEFAAVAARLGEANGAYRGPAGTALVFMTFGEIKLSKP